MVRRVGSFEVEGEGLEGVWDFGRNTLSSCQSLLPNQQTTIVKAYIPNR